MPGIQRRSSAWPNWVIWEPGADDQKKAKYQTVEDIFIAVGRLLGRTNPRYVWRGHRDINWPLTPTLHRKFISVVDSPAVDEPAFATWVVEEQGALIARAQAAGHGIGNVSGGTSSELRQLALLQHHGAATGLLDVTADPFVALYFAALLGDDETHGALIAIDATTELPGRRRWHAIEYGMTTERPYSDLVLEIESDKTADFGMYRPPQFTSRIAVQRSHFIFSNPVARDSGTIDIAPMPLEMDAEARLARIFDGQRTGGHTATLPITVIKISRNVKREVLAHLSTKMGISLETLFPDLDGFARAYDDTSAPLTPPPKQPPDSGSSAFGASPFGASALGE